MNREKEKQVFLPHLFFYLKEESSMDKTGGFMLDQELIFENLYYDGENFWFTARNYNALFRMNKDDREPELRGIVPGEGILQCCLYNAMTMCNGKLYFAPFAANEIAEYDPVTGRFRKIAVTLPGAENDRLWEQAKFSNAISIGKKVYFIPFFYPGILVFDTETDYIVCIDDWVEEIERIHVGEWGYFKEAAQAGRKLTLPCMCADAVVIIDIETEKSRIIKTPPTVHSCKYCGVFFVVSYFYLISADGKVSKRKLESEEEEVKIIQIPVFGADEIAFYPLRCVDHIIYLFPTKSSKGFSINTITDEVQPTALLDDDKASIGDNPCYIASVSGERKLYAFTGNSHCFVTFDFEKVSKDICKLYASEEDRLLIEAARREELFRKMSSSAWENTENSLVYMMHVLQIREGEVKGSLNKHRTEIGKKIYEAIISEE